MLRFDAAHSEDPITENIDGFEHPKELLYARRMTIWLEKLAPYASEPLRLAARCQHIRRWSIPRTEYPMDRRGYLRWRTALAALHAETAGQILSDVGYDRETIEKVQVLLRKERMKLDPEVQLLEDVVCLVFLENYFAEFAAQHDVEKLVRIVRKTWQKMSPRGREVARTLSFPSHLHAVVDEAIGGAGQGKDGTPWS